MTGLILKDLYVIKKTITYMIFIIFIFVGVYTTIGNEYFVSFFVSIMTVSVLISSMSYDEFYHWDRYAAVLPLSKQKIVGAKYLTALLLYAGGTLFTIVVQVAVYTLRGFSFAGEDILFMSIAPLVGLIGTSVVLPCCYRFGIQQSRLIMMALYGIPSLLLVLTLKFFPELFVEGVIANFSLPAFALGLLALTVLALGISFLVTVRIMEKKELK